MASKLVHFDDAEPLPALRSVGGKGYSLIRMSREGLPVPPGFVLTVDFFDSWFEVITASQSWQDFVHAPPEEMEACAARLPPLTDGLSFDGEQKALVAQALDRLGRFPLFAVRSSSPEEDLAGASFAGGYETILGANQATTESAVCRAFASCLQPRVFVYKREQGFKVNSALIAVVVQAQIASEIAGVGFSVEPISNDYDRAVFNANWGLGETVVSGLASPDQYVVDKASGEVLETAIGAKETSIWLLPGGGTEERVDDRHGQRTLSDEQLALMTRQINRIEDLYGRPMDIEWAWQDDQFYLLQARPITTFLPLPPALETPPGERRRLYLDATLSIQGIQQPLSVMGLDVLYALLRQLSHQVTGEIHVVQPDEGLVSFAGNRLYLVLSHLFHLVEPEKFGTFIGNMDSLVSEVLADVDPKAYLSDPCPAYLHHLVPRIVAHVSDIPVKGLEAALAPEHSARVYHRTVEKVLDGIEANEEATESTSRYAEWLSSQFAHLMVRTLIPRLMAAIAAASRLKSMFAEVAKEDPQAAADLVNIDQALPHNVTIEMGMGLWSIAESVKGFDIASSEELGLRLDGSDLPKEVVQAWREFLDRYGFRGPQELDIAAPRYRDQPELLHKQIHSLMSLPDGSNPRSIHERSVERRRQAHARLRRRAHDMGGIEGAEYDLLYRTIEHFGGFRENHKYYLVRTISFLRRRVLREADSLVAGGRLVHSGQVFDLTLEDLTRALDDPSLDLQALIVQNTEFLRKLDHVREFPHLVDSRGRILRARRPAPKAGELAGQAISPGTARGPVKVLHSPDEKPILPGDILVARATDPGWTPLFVNAAAIVLEVGGMLQHGSLVAREYGKPCVAGVQDATSVLKDGQNAMVDGTVGIVRLE